MGIYDGVLLFILIVKLFVLFYVVRNKISSTEESIKRMNFFEHVFTVSMSLLMIYLFNPWSLHDKIDKETRLFLMAFAILTLAHSFSQG
jgi:hypothetical protein